MVMDSAAGDITGTAETPRGELPDPSYSLGRIVPLTAGNKEATVMERAGIKSPAAQTATLQRVEGEPLSHERVTSDMGFVILSLSLLIVALLSLFGRKSVLRGLLTISFRRHETHTPAGASEVFAWPQIARNLFTIINISLFATILVISRGITIPFGHNSPVATTAIFAGSLLAALVVRHLVSIVLAEITNREALFREYMMVIYNIWFAIAAFLFVINAIVLFAPLNNSGPLLDTGLIIGSILLLIRALRLLWIFRDARISLFYYILYLCALEVLPILVVLKITGLV